MMQKLYAMVKRKKKARKGKGFSKDELKAAGLTVGIALNMGVPVDTRRSTKHGANIRSLKKYFEKDEDIVDRAKAEVKQSKVADGEVARSLTQIKGIGRKRAEKLVSMGINSVKKLAEADSKALAEKINVSEKRVSRWVGDASKLTPRKKK
jgi:predicted flap endonuclease-1-like 5' DNA nuclease